MITNYFSSILLTIIVLLIGIFTNKINKSFINKYGNKHNIKKSRRLLLQKFSTFVISVLVFFSLIIFWGINITNLSVLVISSISVIGIAFFASWCLLINVFASLLLYYSSPIKIEDLITNKYCNNSITVVVIDMTLFYVFLKDDSGDKINIPNNVILQKIVVKHSK